MGEGVESEERFGRRATKALYSPSVKLALFMKFKISKKPVSRDFRVQSDAGGFSIGTHPDNRKKILTFQLYLPQDANEESSVYTYGTCLHTPEQHKMRDKNRWIGAVRKEDGVCREQRVRVSGDAIVVSFRGKSCGEIERCQKNNHVELVHARDGRRAESMGGRSSLVTRRLRNIRDRYSQ